MSKEHLNKEDTKLMSFLYIAQKKRKINPLWVLFFTKEGWIYIALGYILFGYFNGGAVTLAGYLALAVWGNRKYNYRFYQFDKLHYFKKITDFLNIRKKRIIEADNISSEFLGAKTPKN
jgi:hypothetical protein